MARMPAAENAGIEPIRIESYGVRLDVRIDDPAIRDAVMDVLPPGWRPASESFPDAEVSLLKAPGSRYGVVGDGTGRIPHAVDLDVALMLLEGHLRDCVARWAPELVFVHAGVVARDGRALVIPGDSFSGKSTLVAALVEAGATYFSDEFAVLDHEGLVHPYAKPLWLRSDGGEREEISASQLGADPHGQPVPPMLILVTRYVPGAAWDPRPVSAGEAALALLSHTVPAQERPADSMRAVRLVAERCRCLRSERPEARDLAPQLLALLEST